MVVLSRQGDPALRLLDPRQSVVGERREQLRREVVSIIQVGLVPDQETLRPRRVSRGEERVRLRQAVDAEHLGAYFRPRLIPLLAGVGGRERFAQLRR